MTPEWRGPDSAGRWFTTVAGYSIVRRGSEADGYEYSGAIDWHPTVEAAVKDVAERPRTRGTYQRGGGA